MKKKIPVHTTTKEPDITPFSMVYSSVWTAYDSGELNPEKLLLFNILYRQVNSYDGKGRTSYEKICVLLKLKPTDQQINRINKLMTQMRDEHELVWFPEHSGSKDFSYLIADFKLAKKPNETEQKWVDIKPYFQSKESSDNRGRERALPKPSAEPMPRHPPPEQRLERSNGEGATSIRDIIRQREIRPPQTNTETQM